jgi:hypothetical protein
MGEDVACGRSVVNRLLMSQIGLRLVCYFFGDGVKISLWEG